MRRIWIFSLLLGSQAAFADPPALEERPFEFSNLFEKSQLNRCEFNRFRGETCQRLMNDLCSKVEFKNQRCRVFAVRKCHEVHGPSEEESRCEKGIMSEYCYGNNPKCGNEELLACKGSSFADRFCGRYQWLECEKDFFRTATCKRFHNRTVIRFHEDKLGDVLLWTMRGENNMRRLIPRLQEAIGKLDEQIEKFKEQRDSISQQISNAIGNIFDVEALKEQKKRLEDSIAAAEHQRDVTRRQLQEAEHTQNVCRTFSPWQRQEQ